MDLIKREDAIKAMADYLDLLGVARRYAKSVINKVPSAENKGEWIYWGKCVFPYECTQCHDKAREDYDFCPYCGARMKGADDE